MTDIPKCDISTTPVACSSDVPIKLSTEENAFERNGEKVSKTDEPSTPTIEKSREKNFEETCNSGKQSKHTTWRKLLKQRELTFWRSWRAQKNYIEQLEGELENLERIKSSLEMENEQLFLSTQRKAFFHDVANDGVSSSFGNFASSNCNDPSTNCDKGPCKHVTYIVSLQKELKKEEKIRPTLSAELQSVMDNIRGMQNKASQLKHHLNTDIFFHRSQECSRFTAHPSDIETFVEREEAFALKTAEQESYTHYLEKELSCVRKYVETLRRESSSLACSDFDPLQATDKHLTQEPGKHVSMIFKLQKDIRQEKDQCGLLRFKLQRAKTKFLAEAGRCVRLSDLVEELNSVALM